MLYWSKNIPPDPYHSAALYLLYRVALFIRNDAKEIGHDQLSDLGDAIHNVPESLTEYGRSFDEQEIRDFYLATYDRKWAKSPDDFSLLRTLDAGIQRVEVWGSSQIESAEKAICEVHLAWIEAVNARDLPRLLALMADDAVFLNPGQAPVGRDGFPAGFLAAHEQNLIRCVSQLEEVVVAGNIAHARSQDSLSVIPRANGEASNFAGHRMTIYRKQPDGRWLLSRDAHTLSPVEKTNS